ncbi:AAA family ATPase [Streptomyces purpurascens]
MVASQRLGSAILWGPPGVGKTTIARLLADGSNLAFEPVSATFSGVADLRKVFAAARAAGAPSARAPCCSSMRSTASTAPSRTASCPTSRTARSP